MKESYYTIYSNPTTIPIEELPIIDYVQFYQEALNMLKNCDCHVVAYFAIDKNDTQWQLFCIIANDKEKSLKVFSFYCNKKNPIIESITPYHNPMHVFEREIYENFGIDFPAHPWLKPIRWANNRSNKKSIMDNYPFFNIKSDEMHEVGVGPVHAGIIEPGHFRFICNGENVHHLEIHLGYQHRGVEDLFLTKKSYLQKAILSESIAGDTAVGHGICYTQLIEALSDTDVPQKLEYERIIALELERIAVHIGDTAALCGDVAYQLGQVVCESLRTIIINTTQYWCGNRFGKGLIRMGGTNYEITSDIAAEIKSNLKHVLVRFGEMTESLFSMPALLNRFDEIGVVTKEQGLHAGLIGMAARMCGINKDIRVSHPFQGYKYFDYKTKILNTGDVLARAILRQNEVFNSAEMIFDLIEKVLNDSEKTNKPNYNPTLKPNNIAISLTEGWRGQITHIALTDNNGQIAKYKIYDPSFNNWMGLALSVRNQEISDFPICNKSFNLSYCGHDL